MANTAVIVKPEYGINYKEGYIGFTFDDASFLSTGIVWFTRWDKGTNTDVPNIPISHCFIVTGPNEIVESWVPQVRKQTLDYYFNDPHKHVAFRKPKAMSDTVSKTISSFAISQIGKAYDILLIVALFITNTFIGKFLEKLTGGRSKMWITNLFHKRHAYICSELVATDLNDIAQYKGLGVLKGSLSSINPQELFEDKVIFEPWAEQVKGTIL